VPLPRVLHEELSDLERKRGFSLHDWFLRAHARDPGIVGAAYGARAVRGVHTADLGVTVFVERKLHQEHVARLSASSLRASRYVSVPQTIGPYRSDVVGIGRVHAAAGDVHKVRPAPGGVSVGLDATTSRIGVAGTLGCLASRDGPKGREWFVLSNAHVIGRSGEGPIGTTIEQPAFFLSSVAGRGIAKLHTVAPIRPAPHANLVDAAIGAIDGNNAKRLVDGDILGIGELRGFRPTAQLRVGTKVEKHGSTTGTTGGHITHLKWSGWVDLDEVVGRVLFRDQIAMKLTAAGGDSGSLVVDPARKVAVGLLFGAGAGVAFASPIEAVQDALDVRVAGSATGATATGPSRGRTPPARTARRR
jgi:hypothetical protein